MVGFDIVVLNNEQDGDKIITRVIGLPNETIEYNIQINTPKTCPIYLPFANNKAVIIPTIEQIGVNKSDLIEFYDSVGIPYLNQSKEELLAELTLFGQIKDKQK